MNVVVVLIPGTFGNHPLSTILDTLEQIFNEYSRYFENISADYGSTEPCTIEICFPQCFFPDEVADVAKSQIQLCIYITRISGIGLC